MTIKQIAPPVKKAIVTELEKLIKKHKFAAVKSVINNYFKNSTERTKALNKIEELKKEISKLEKVK